MSKTCGWCQKPGIMKRWVVRIRRITRIEDRTIDFCNALEARSWRRQLGKRFVKWLKVGETTSDMLSRQRSAGNAGG